MDHTNIVIFRSSTARDVFPKDEVYLQQLSRIGAGQRVIFKTVDNLAEMIRKFEMFDLPDKSMAHFIIQAHGNPYGFTIGQDTINMDSTPRLWKQLRDFFVHEVQRKLTPNGSVFIHACSSALEPQSIANVLSRLLPHHIFYGATDIILMDDLQIIPSDRTIIAYQVSEEKNRSGYRIVTLKGGHELIQEEERQYEAALRASLRSQQQQRQEADRLRRQQQEDRLAIAESRRFQKQKQEADRLRRQKQEAERFRRQRQEQIPSYD